MEKERENHEWLVQSDIDLSGINLCWYPVNMSKSVPVAGNAKNKPRSGARIQPTMWLVFRVYVSVILYRTPIFFNI